ncbi:hypothetical protein EII20_13845 [Comamonadaceae bacterium OH2545_COT-014]|nr:hypothetical protein EII20_13845 [Comamonadaceae bacterium OH2545_COT-014]
MQISLYQDEHGWNAKTVIKLAQGRQLHVRTFKPPGMPTLQTWAAVWSSAGTAGIMVFRPREDGGQDFSRCLLSVGVSRVTKRAVRLQHESALAQIGPVRHEAEGWHQDSGHEARS